LVDTTAVPPPARPGSGGEAEASGSPAVHTDPISPYSLSLDRRRPRRVAGVADHAPDAGRRLLPGHAIAFDTSERRVGST